MTKLTARQHEILQKIDTRWRRPMDIGGRDGSHHARTLAALTTKGLVERRQRGGHHYIRPSYEYRISTAGKALLDQTRDSPAPPMSES